LATFFEGYLTLQLLQASLRVLRNKCFLNFYVIRVIEHGILSYRVGKR